MKICVNCRCELRCERTGALAHFGNGHCYSVDVFACHECGAMIGIGSVPHHVDMDNLHPSILDDYVIEMAPKSKEKPNETTNNLTR